MFTKILIGHDLHEGGDDALALGRTLAHASGAAMVVAKIFPLELVPHGAGSGWREREAQALKDLLRVAEIAGADADVYPSSSRARGLSELADEIGADLIVIGSSRRGALEQVLVGNVGFRLLHGASCPVAVAPREYRQGEGGPRKITVGYDGSDESRLALSGAFELAAAARLPVKVVAVAESPPIEYGMGTVPQPGWDDLYVTAEAQAAERVEEARAAAPEGLVVEPLVVKGNAASALAEASEPDGGILLLGSRAYGPVKSVLLGSVSSQLVRSARCPVLVFPRGTEGGNSHTAARAADHYAAPTST